MLRLSQLPVLAASAALVAIGLAAPALGASAASVGVRTDAQLGSVLVDDQGMTLYRFTPDQPNTSTCYDACARAWPPLLVDAAPAVPDPTLAAGLGVAPRNDGTQQLTYQGAPLYLFVGDSQPGDTNGQGSGGIWFVVSAPTSAGASDSASPTAPTVAPAPATPSYQYRGGY
jgi:predicted lipoprotein with Yx(FWY)xxD motif